MDDAVLARRAISGDLDSFGQLYDAYFNRVYDFCWRILRDADEAADATQDVFMKAMRSIGGLSKAQSFKSWLFTIAHNTAITSAERAGRTVPLPVAAPDEAFGTFDVPDPSRVDNPELVAEHHELASLVWEAAAALNPRDYALLDLHVRQGLESAEIAGILGVSKGSAYTMVSRMKQAAGNVFSSYLVARRGSRDCEELQRLLAGHTLPPYTDELRRTVDEHVATCLTCQETKRALVAPMSLFSSFAVIPAPLALKSDTWRELSTAWPYGDGAATAAGNGASSYAAFAAAGAGADGGAANPPLPPASPMFEDGDGGNRIVLFAVAVLGMLLIAFFIAGGAILAGDLGGDGDGDGGGGGDETPEATASPEGTPDDQTPSVIVETNTPAPTDTPGPTDTPTLSPTVAPDTPTPLPTQPPPASPTPPPTQPPGPEPTRDRPGGPPVFPTVPSGG